MELGSGGVALRGTFPDLLATDIIQSDALDRVLNAEEMDFKNEEVRTVFGQNVFHHIGDPEIFLGNYLGS